MLRYDPYAHQAYRERLQLSLKSKSRSMVEDVSARGFEKAARRAEYSQQETYLEPGKHIGRREAIIAMTKKQAAFTTRAEAEKAKSAGYIESKEGDIRKRGYWEKQRKVTYKSAGFKYKGAGGTGKFSAKELEQWGGPGSSWGQSSW